MQYIIATFDQTKSCIIMQYIYDVKHLINYTKSIITQSGSVMSMLRHSTYTCTALNRLMHRCLSLVVRLSSCLCFTWNIKTTKGQRRK